MVPFHNFRLDLVVDQVLVLDQVGAQVLDHTLVLSIENHHICDLWDGCCWLNTAEIHQSGKNENSRWYPSENSKSFLQRHRRCKVEPIILH